MTPIRVGENEKTSQFPISLLYLAFEGKNEIRNVKK